MRSCILSLKFSSVRQDENDEVAFGPTSLFFPLTLGEVEAERQVASGHICIVYVLKHTHMRFAHL